MQIRTACLALGLMLAISGGTRAAGLDLKRYMPLSEIQVGMTGTGKTTLEGTTIVEFQVKVVAIIKNEGPKRDLIMIRCGGAGLEESGVIAGMSGSPVYINGRLIGAVAYAFPWCKIPLAGVQPVEQMLRVTDESPWARAEPPPALTDRGPAGTLSVPAASLGLANVPVPAGRDTCDMQPIQTPVMVGGLSPRAMERLGESLAPFGLVPMQGGGADPKAVQAARLEPGAPLAVPLLRGDIQVIAMGTITEIAGDRLYAFGHAMFAAGQSDLPLMTGVATVVIPSLMNSRRIGAAAGEVGRLTWDEETGIFGRLGNQRAPRVPVSVTVIGPTRGMERTYRSEMIHHRLLSPALAATVIGGGLTAISDLPRDHTVAYRICVKPVGLDPIVRENLAVSPGGDAYVESQVRSLVGLMVENPFRNLTVESVEVQVTIEPVSRLAEIQGVRPLRNTVRPGGTVPVEVKVRPWRAEPRWITVEVKVPADYPEGPCRMNLCGADEALREEMREAPVRFRPDDLESLVAMLKRDERRDQLFIRLGAPGAGLAIGRDELPNLPAAMRSVLAESARRQVTGVTGALVTRQPMPYVLQGGQSFEVTVDRKAPEK